jgi:hypothetical protein
MCIEKSGPGPTDWAELQHPELPQSGRPPLGAMTTPALAMEAGTIGRAIRRARRFHDVLVIPPLDAAIVSATVDRRSAPPGTTALIARWRSPWAVVYVRRAFRSPILTCAMPATKVRGVSP